MFMCTMLMYTAILSLCIETMYDEVRRLVFLEPNVLPCRQVVMNADAVRMYSLMRYGFDSF